VPVTAGAAIRGRTALAATTVPAAAADARNRNRRDVPAAPDSSAEMLIDCALLYKWPSGSRSVHTATPAEQNIRLKSPDALHKNAR
jgi:hypothetical protein